jgi:uncharacterized SAM-binding protein YcdF (DUF218 family)
MDLHCTSTIAGASPRRGQNRKDRLTTVLPISGDILEDDTAPIALVASLARRYPQATILFSGGDDPSKTGLGEAAIAKQLFDSFGINASRIFIEDQSRNTRENAFFPTA